MILVALALLAAPGPEERTDRVPVDLRLDVRMTTRTQYVRDMLEDTRAKFAGGLLGEIRGRFPDEGPASPGAMRWSQYAARVSDMTLGFTVNRVRPAGRDRAVSIAWTRGWRDGDVGREEEGAATVSFVWDGRNYGIAGVEGANPFELPAPANAIDLVLGQVRLPRDATAGRTVRCTIGVENDGATAADDVRVEIREGRRTLASGQLDIPPGQTREIELEFQASHDAREVTVVVDPADAVPERNEQNNSRRLTLRRGTQTDLILRAVRYLGEAADLRPGGTLLYEAQVENRGGEELDRVRVEVRDGRRTVASRDVRFEARSTERVEIEIRLERDAELVFVVDPANEIEESDENNNERRESVRLVEPLPDLVFVAGSVRVSGGRVYATVRNGGGARAGAFTVRLNFSNRPSIDESVAGLDAGAERRMVFTIPASTAATGAAAAPRDLVLDPDDRVREANENNNSAGAP